MTRAIATAAFSERRMARRTLLKLSGVGALAAAVPIGCTGATREDVDLEDLRPIIDNAAGRSAVPTIRLLTFTPSDDAQHYQMSEMIAEAWRAAGLDVELKPASAAAITQAVFLEDKDFDVYFVNWGPTTDRLDPDAMLKHFYNGRAEPATNISGLNSTDFDRLYRAQLAAETPEERRRLVDEAQELLFRLKPESPVVYPFVAAAYREDQWSGIEPALGNPLFNVWNALEATPKSGQSTLTIGTIYEPPTLNPVILDATEAQNPLSLIYDSLVRIGRDGTVENWAAQRLTTSGASIVCELRPGMTFSDGESVTGHDVKFTIEFLKAEESPIFSSLLEPVDAVDATSTGVTIRLHAPTASFVTTALSQMPILPEHVWSTISDLKSYPNTVPVGSGPFTLIDRTLGTGIEFKANREHFSPPRVDKVFLAILGDFGAEIAALVEGAIDIVGDYKDPFAFESIEGSDGVRVVTAQSYGWRGLIYNLRKAPYDDVYFRRALSELVPSEDIITTVLGGRGQPGGSVIAPALKRWHSAAVSVTPYDPKASMAAFETAGYGFTADGQLYYPAPGADRRERQRAL